jgi:uncharacterized repeat protein (TIGR03803 family)
MANPRKNQFLLSVLLIAAFASIGTGHISAQGFQVLHTFTLAPNDNNTDGRNPDAGLFLAGNMLFGTASDAGQHGAGAIFGLNTDGSGFTPYFSFSQAGGTFTSTNREGGHPQAPLIFTGTALYGTASQDGTNASGTVYELSLATGVKVLHTFGVNSLPFNAGTNSDGSSPVAGLVLSGTSLYGTAQSGGIYGNGTIFKVDDTSLVFTNLHNFSALQTNGPFLYTNGDGTLPLGRLVLSGDMLYGTASAGGIHGNGTIFAMTTNGTGFTTLHHFGALGDDSALNDTATNFDGASPSAGLVLTNNTLYGVAQYGGLAGNGTVFAISTSGMGFTVLHEFAPGAHDPSVVSFGTGFTNRDGAHPSGDLVLSGNILYGTTVTGGTNGSGTVFSLGTNGANFASLYAFTALNTNSAPIDPLYTNSDGVEPLGGLVISSNVLYGTTSFGGLNSDGTVFSLSVLPQIGLVRSGTNVILTWSTNLPGFTLEFTTNLAPTADWVTNPTAPVVLNGQYALTNAASGKQKFFRLIQ